MNERNDGADEEYEKSLIILALIVVFILVSGIIVLGGMDPSLDWTRMANETL